VVADEATTKLPKWCLNTYKKQTMNTTRHYNINNNEEVHVTSITVITIRLLQSIFISQRKIVCFQARFKLRQKGNRSN